MNSRDCLTTKTQAMTRDAELVEAARRGSSTAFGQIERLYSRPLYRTIIAITKNQEDAEDALQETFLRAYLALETFEGRASFYSWLTRIAINSALMNIRKRRARAEVFVNPPCEDQEQTPFEIKDVALNPEQVFDQHQRCVGMLRAVQNLDENLRGPIQLRMMRECSMKEIAHALDVTVATVKSRLHRARRRLASAHVPRNSADATRAAAV
jgi:RNA polymerase sigma-70 factor (ECF subfamily)